MFNNFKTNTTNYLKNFFLNMNPTIILTAIDFISIIAVNLQQLNNNYIYPLYNNLLVPAYNTITLKSDKEINIIQSGEIIETFYDLDNYNDNIPLLDDTEKLIIISYNSGNAEAANECSLIYKDNEIINKNYVDTRRNIDYKFILITVTIITDKGIERFDIHLDKDKNYYIEDNVLLTYPFLKWYLKQTYNYNLKTKEYSTKIIDQNANTICIYADQYIKLNYDNYIILNKTEKDLNKKLD